MVVTSQVTEDQMKFRTTILQSGKTATGIQVPNDIVAALGAGKRPPVKVTINGYTYRSTVAGMGGVFMVGVNADNRAAAGFAGRWDRWRRRAARIQRRVPEAGYRVVVD